MVELTRPMRNIYLNLRIMLPRHSTLIRMASNLFRLHINGELNPRLRRGLLFNFRGNFTKVKSAISKLRYNVVTTYVRMCFRRMITSLFNVEEIQRLIRRFLRSNRQFTRDKVKNLIGTWNMIVNNLFLSFRVNIKNNDLLRNRAHFNLIYRLRVDRSRIRMYILQGNVIFNDRSTRSKKSLQVRTTLVVKRSRRMGNVPSVDNEFNVIFCVLSRKLCNFIVLPRVMFNYARSAIRLHHINMTRAIKVN